MDMQSTIINNITMKVVFVVVGVVAEQHKSEDHTKREMAIVGIWMQGAVTFKKSHQVQCTFLELVRFVTVFSKKLAQNTPKKPVV